jgi:hypothetical protein
LTRFAEAIKGVEKTLVGLVLGSALFTSLLVIAQVGRFTREFMALTEVIGVISGTAAVVMVFLGRIRHPEDEIKHLLEHRPRLLAGKAAVWLLASAICLYVYYRFALLQSDVCLLFLAPGTYFFFLTLRIGCRVDSDTSAAAAGMV